MNHNTQAPSNGQTTQQERAAPPAELAAFRHEFQRRYRAYHPAGDADDMFFKPDSLLNKRNFVNAFNKNMGDMTTPHSRLGEKPASLQPLTMEHLDAMLEGRAGMPAHMVRPMSLTFRLYNAEREIFEAACEDAVQFDKQQRHAAWLASPEGIAAEAARAERERALAERQQKAEQAERLRATRAAQVPAWRTRNPEGLAEKKSFQEMLDESVNAKEDFVQFLFARVMPEWNNISQVKFCAHMERLNAGNHALPKKTLSDKVLSNWHAGTGKPLRDSAEVMCAAFGIVPQEGERMALHERKLWKIIDGHPFAYRDKTGEAALAAAIADAQATRDTSALMTELISASGIRFERLQQVLGVQQIPAWKKGARIDSVQTALDVIDLTGPLVPRDMMTVQQRAARRELLAVLTGREFDINTLIENARAAGNPGGELLSGLTGRAGLVSISPRELSAKVSSRELPVTEEQVKKMRTGTQLQRGGKIFEPVAENIMKLVEQEMRTLIAQGIVDPVTPGQHAAAIDVLTRYEHPKKMLEKCVKGEKAVGDMVRDTCERRGLNLMGPKSFCEEVGLTHLSDFVLSKANLEPESARKIASWYKEKYEFTEDECQQFVALARGVNRTRTPDIILAQVQAGAVDRTEGLRQIYDYAGLTRDALAAQAKVEPRVIQYSVNNVSGGRIMADAEAVRRIGAAAGVSEAKLREFAETFDGNRVKRDLAKSADSAVARLKARSGGNGGTPGNL